MITTILMGYMQTFFSSNIIQLVSKDVANPGAEMHREVGLFVTATVILTGFTLAVMFWWERKEKKIVIPSAQMTPHAG